MRLAKAGLRIAHHEHVERRGKGNRFVSATRAGWYIEVHRSSRWYALMDLRFMREKDALRAAQSLTAAGLDSYSAMQRVDPITVKEVACRFLQW